MIKLIISIIYFFLLITGLGYSISYLFKIKFNNIWEQIIMILGFGLGIFPILSSFIGILHITIHWLIFLLISMIIPIYSLVKKKYEISKWEYDKFAIITVFLSILYLSIFLIGTLGYSHLPDDDPYEEALTIKYLAQEKTIYETNTFDVRYIDTYTPSYYILLSLTYQINNTMIPNLKIFNCLIIALGLLFFYFFAVEFFKDKQKAALASFVVLILPCFMSNFPWAQSLAVVLFFPALYCLEKGYKILSMLIIASILVTQPSCAFIFLVLAGIYAIFKDYKLLLPISGGVLLSGIVYWFPMVFLKGIPSTLEGIGFSTGLISNAGVGNDTSGGIIYGLKDFIFALPYGRMDQAIGFGPVIFLLVLFSIILLVINYKKIDRNILITISWFIFCLVATEGNALPYKLFPHRFWVFLSIPVILLTVYGISIILDSVNSNILKSCILGFLIIVITLTSGMPKFQMQSSVWPAGVDLQNSEEISLFTWMDDNLIKNSNVFQFGMTNDRYVIAFDMDSNSWDDNVVEFRKNMTTKNLEDIYTFLTSNNYTYIIFNNMGQRRMVNDYGMNETAEFFGRLNSELQQTNKFILAYQNNAGIILQPIYID